MELSASSQLGTAPPKRPQNALEVAETILQDFNTRIQKLGLIIKDTANYLTGESLPNPESISERALSPVGGQIGTIHEQLISMRTALTYVEEQLSRLSQFQ